MTKIRQLLTKDWKIKLTCLILASALWYLVLKNVNVETSRSWPDREDIPAKTATKR